jgi:hypothetical protein
LWIDAGRPGKPPIPPQPSFPLPFIPLTRHSRESGNLLFSTAAKMIAALDGEQVGRKSEARSAAFGEVVPAGR